MIIKVPRFAIEWESEYDKLFIAFMYYVSEQHGFKTQYDIYPDDVRTILQKYVLEPIRNFEMGANHFMIGKRNTYSWLFRWKHEPIAVDYEFTDERANLIWGYLMGRETEDGTLVNEIPKSIDEAPKHVLHPRKKHLFRFYDDHRTKKKKK
jgi:hypothetical protein